jgi:signal transduction histidine kinase
VVDDFSSVHGDRFIVTLENKDLQGSWDCNAIRRILENLIGNALKYGSTDQPIDIRAGGRGDEVYFSVHNYGNKIEQADLDKLFIPYRRIQTTLTSEQKGWGLGLTLVKGFAEKFGGHVEVSSTIEKGTLFTVILKKGPV